MAQVIVTADSDLPPAVKLILGIPDPAAVHLCKVSPKTASIEEWNEIMRLVDSHDSFEAIERVPLTRRITALLNRNAYLQSRDPILHGEDLSYIAVVRQIVES